MKYEMKPQLKSGSDLNLYVKNQRGIQIKFGSSECKLGHEGCW